MKKSLKHFEFQTSKAGMTSIEFLLGSYATGRMSLFVCFNLGKAHCYKWLMPGLTKTEINS